MREIILSNGMVAMVDDQDFEYANTYSWHHNGAGYAYAKLVGLDRAITLHHLIAIRTSLNLNFKIDHQDRDRLNCCRSNLRQSTNSQNGHNAKLRSDNTSGFRGVSFCKSKNKWLAVLYVEKHRLHLGYYSNIREAAIAYNQAALRYFGVFANLNEVNKQ